MPYLLKTFTSASLLMFAQFSFCQLASVTNQKIAAGNSAAAATDHQVVLHAVSVFQGTIKVGPIQTGKHGEFRMSAYYEPGNKAYQSFNIPDNAVAWFYSYSATWDLKNMRDPDLLRQLQTEFLANSHERTVPISSGDLCKEVLSQLKTYQGFGAASVAAEDLDNAKTFEKRLSESVHYVGFTGGNLGSDRGLVLNFKPGPNRIGIANGNTDKQRGDVWINLEVVAVVRQANPGQNVQALNGWTEEAKRPVYRKFRSLYHNLRHDIAEDCVSCALKKITSTMSSYEYDQMPRREKYDDDLSNNCYEQIALPLVTAQKKRTAGVDKGNLGWESYKLGNIEDCIKYSRQALQEDSTLGWVKANIALCYVVKQDLTNARTFYSAACYDILRLPLLQSSKEDLDNAYQNLDNLYKRDHSVKGYSEFRDMILEAARKMNAPN